VIVFRFPDPEHDLEAVKLLQEIVRPRWGIDFVRAADSGEWSLHFPRPNADRMEYQLEIVHPGGHAETIQDPFNPKRSSGPFGHRSVIEFPGYRSPAWLDEDVPRGDVHEFQLKSRSVRGRVDGLLWTSAGSDDTSALPLLIVHDGPEYAKLSELTRLLDVLIAHGKVPAMRAALLQPHDRNEIYSASAAYSRALAHEILPRLYEVVATPHGRRWRIGMGASLGALAMLHTHRRYPATFGALFLQSGSFFRQRFDKQESHFPRFRRIARFMGQVLSTDPWPHPVPVAMTCGTVEENLANNRVTRDSLVAQGYEVSFTENRDAHNWVGWRDAFDPPLVELLTKAWG
jgi:enterochelin esterase family protein